MPPSDGHKHETEGWTTRFYRRIMNPLILRPRRRWLFLASVVVLLLLACSLVAFKLVKVKMLPFDNKSEFQVIVDMPNGTTLEQTTHVAQELGQYLGQQPEVLNYEIYSGTSGPFNFNGLVRHYFLRRGANQADIQVNLLNQHERRSKATKSPSACDPGLWRSATGMVRASKSPRCRRARRCYRRWWQRFTVRTISSRSRSQNRSSTSFRPLREWWTWTGMWKTRRRSMT